MIILSLQVPPTKRAQESIQRRLWILWRIWTESSRLSQQEKQPKKGQKSKTQQKKKQKGKGDSKGKGHLDTSKIKCFTCGEYGYFACDCPKAHNNANIARKSEQKGKSESMLDLDSTSVSEECVKVCTELQYEDASKDQVVYGDQGISAEEYEKATYGDFTKTQSEEEDEVKCTVRQKYWSKYCMV